LRHDLEYNSERNGLIIPEYGRHIQKMVEKTVEIEDDEERNKAAYNIIDVMGNVAPHLRDVPDFEQKLWDQLFIISDFKLDVDAPFPKPTREELQEPPAPLDYPLADPKYKFYGHNIKKMIDVAKGWEDGDKREALVFTIANHMKKCYLNWNRETVDDDVIFDHLYELSDGDINLKKKEEDLKHASKLVRKKHHVKSNKPKRHSNNSNHRNQRSHSKSNYRGKRR